MMSEITEIFWCFSMDVFKVVINQTWTYADTWTHARTQTQALARRHVRSHAYVQNKQMIASVSVKNTNVAQICLRSLHHGLSSRTSRPVYSHTIKQSLQHEKQAKAQPVNVKAVFSNRILWNIKILLNNWCLSQLVLDSEILHELRIHFRKTQFSVM